MKVSIQIPTYNQAAYISKAIQSALDQDYPHLEIVVLDDNSPDNTFEMANQFQSDKVFVYKNEQNLGRVGNYRKLLYEKVTGDWVVNLDGDDFFTDNQFVSNAMKQILANENVVFYQAAIKSQSGETEFQFQHKMLQGKSMDLLDGKKYFKQFHVNEFFGHLSTVYKVNAAKDIGFYEYDSIISDAESLLKLALHGNVILDNSIVGVWNIHGANESKAMLTKNDAILASFKRVSEYSIPFIGIDEANKWLQKANHLNRISFAELLAKNDFPKFLKDSLFSDYFSSQFWKLIVKKLIGKI